MSSAGELEPLAAACVLPGFEGLRAPDWVRRRLADGLGGVVLFARNIRDGAQLAELTAALRAERDDVVVAADEEGGDVTRLEAARGSSYPGNLALGAVDDVELTRAVASSIGRDLANVGVNVNLAPVADVNTNSDNPIVGVRAFGSDASLVARHVAAYVDGLQAAGVAACAKHFPGHGDTAQDSHLELPAVEAVTEEALEPFRAAIAAGVRSIMTAHIRVRALGDEPATVSRAVLGDLLRGELGFDGAVITDALEMKGLSGSVGVEEGAVRALAAGADSLCLGHDLGDEATGAVVQAIVAAVRAGRLAEERLRDAADRVRLLGTPHRVSTLPREDRGARVGLEAARRALVAEGRVELAAPALVVDLRSEPSIAAGRDGAALQDFLPGVEVVRAVPADRDGRQPVLVVRDAHRHPTQRDAVAAAGEDAIVVEIGLPLWRPSAVAGYLATYGAGRVNLAAAAERLGALRE